MNRATARPWKARPSGMILNDTGNVYFVAEVISHMKRGSELTPQDAANAALIVHCVNSFEAMRKALECAKLDIMNATKPDDFELAVCRINDALAQANDVQV